jgi:adenine-specific DNA-methyltransferase
LACSNYASSSFALLPKSDSSANDWNAEGRAYWMPTLRWLTRDDDIRAAGKVPYRVLEEVPELGYGEQDSGNMLIQGDNLDALKALLPFYAGQVKCIFIDPPYNTRSAFEHYDDNLEHSQWLAMMWPRLELLREFLSQDGSIWVSIDDNEGHYLKVMMDEVFGRRNFIANALWQKVFSPKNTARHFSDDHDHILVVARDADRWVPNPMPRSDRMNKGYKNADNDPRGLWTSGDVSARNFYGAGRYAIKCPSGRIIPGPPNGMYCECQKSGSGRWIAINEFGGVKTEIIRHASSASSRR